MTDLELATLGSSSLAGPEGEELFPVLSQPKRFALLVYLTLARPRGFHRRDTLLSLFWPELDSRRGRNALSQALSFLRANLPPGVILTRGVEEVAVDHTRFSTGVGALEEALCAERWAEALDAYHGEFLQGFRLAGAPGFEEWADRERQRLKDAVAQAGWSLAWEKLERGALVEAERRALQAMELARTDETPVRRFIEGLGRAGDRAGALRLLERYGERLRRELELDPSPAMRALERRFREGGGIGPLPVSEGPGARQRTSKSPESGRRRILLPLLGAAVAVLAIVPVLRRGEASTSTAGRKPSFTIMAEVEGSADEDIREAVAFLLRTGLDVGPAVRTVPDPQLARTLELMRVETPVRLDAALAREVGARLGVARVVVPRLDRLGGRLLLVLRVEDVGEGLLVGQAQGTVEEDGELVSLVGQELGKLLAQLGEDPEALAVREALPFYTTTSLEALRAFVAANRAAREGDHARSLALNREALRLDPAFAMAWRRLAAVPGQTREERDRAIARAFQLSEHLSRYERLNIRARYALQSFRWEDAIREYETLLAEYPEDVDGWMNLGYAHGQLGAFDRYLEASRESVRIRVGPYNTANLIEAALILGKGEEAREALALLEEHVPGHPATPDLAFFVAVGEGNLLEARELCRRGRVSAPTPRDGVIHLLRLSRLAAGEGRVGDMREWLSLAGEATETRRLGLGESVWLADFERMTLGRPGLAQAHLAGVYSDLRPEDVPLSNPWSGIRALVLLGRPREARKLLERWETEQPEKLRLRDRPSELRARAEIASAEGRTEEALSRARESVRESHGSPAAEGYLAWVYDQANQPDSALAAFRRYLEAPHLGRWVWDPIFLPLAYERLGQLFEDRGDWEAADRYRQLLVDLWAEADPGLRRRVEAARSAQRRLGRSP